MVKKIFSRIPNKYLLVTLGLLVWMAFFDNNSFLMRYRLRRSLKLYEKEMRYYNQQIVKDSTSLNDLLSDKETLERFAREEYLMKKPDEDIFLITDND